VPLPSIPPPNDLSAAERRLWPLIAAKAPASADPIDVATYVRAVVARDAANATINRLHKRLRLDKAATDVRALIG
jgi:hypothetical protein